MVSGTTGSWVHNDQDCDDNNNTVWIGAPCDDNGASECGGAINSACKCESGAGGSEKYFADVDGDGFGDADNYITSCDGKAPTGYVHNSDDCDDEDPANYPWAPCFTGTNCTTFIDPSCFCATKDPDRDGICDGMDMCPNEDDKIDEDYNGLPDCIENCSGFD